MHVSERFLKYVTYETTSDESQITCPSTPGQKVLGEVLVEELLSLGIQDAHMDTNGYVMGTILANTDRQIPTIGFIAHMDTSPDMTTQGTAPRIVSNYDGNAIVLDKKDAIILSPNDFPALNHYVGQDLIVTNGHTLLGADDKAGIAEIMTLAQHLMENPDFEHGTIKIGFTPDEEIGRGANFFDVEKFGADYAYTVDGGQLGELEYESFNANNFHLRIQGRNVHPGTAKNQMINATEIAYEFHHMLPAAEKPQYTEKYEGFFHLTHINGTVETAEVGYILRDHDLNQFQQKKTLVEKAVDYLNEKYGKDTVLLDMKDVYYNMAAPILEHFHLVETAKTVMMDLGITPLMVPIRGGTDGSRLSYMGLPCPNIFTGGHNYHGRYEFIPIPSMVKAVETLLGVVKAYGQPKIESDS